MRKISFILLPLLFLLLLSSTNIPETQASESKESLEDAKMVTQSFIKANEMYKWQDAEIALKLELYGLEDEVLGYYFDVIDNGQAVGYVLASADKGLPPILQYGEGQFAEEGISTMRHDTKFYYLGGLRYSISENAENVKQNYQQNYQQRVNSLSENYLDDNTLNPELKPIPRDVNQFKESWDSLLNNNNIQSTYRTLNVSRVYQRVSGVNKPDAACGPTVGVMIARFLRNYDDKIRNYTDANFINHLDNLMGTYYWGTYANQWGQGMEDHLNFNHLPSHKWYVMHSRANGNWNQYYNSINNNRPVALRFDFFTGDQAYDNYHFVAGIGYDFIQNDAYAGVKDPDGGSNNTGTHWFSWYINAPDLAMIRIDN